MSVVEHIFEKPKRSPAQGVAVTTLDFADTAYTNTAYTSAVSAEPATTIRFGVATIQLHDDLWRVTMRNGEVLGYVERITSAAGHRFVAKRMLQRQRRFLPIGEFWSMDDAMDCFRF